MGIKPTGFSIPLFGVSWEYTDSEKKGVQELLFFLETKRILVNPIEMEIKDWCEQSAIEIKKELNTLLSKCNYSENTVECIRLMIGACNTFLDDASTIDVNGIIYKNQKGDWENNRFSSAMKKFRKTFRYNINSLASTFNLTFPKEIPEQY